MKYITLLILATFLSGCDNSGQDATNNEYKAKKELIYKHDIQKLKSLVNLSGVNVLDATWTTGERYIAEKKQSRFLDIDLDANQWWLHAAVKSDSDLSFIKKMCNHRYTLQMKKIFPRMEISKLTNSPLFNGDKDYYIYDACTLHKSPLTMGVVAIDEENGILLMLMETFS
ncbi:hypothetical protein L4C36_13165 [Photobacterium japonica]|uniref:hypothetical protein n=1 Tax=Photobacterium japonica TaxID=2910235 RepID=UPI003D0C7918